MNKVDNKVKKIKVKEAASSTANPITFKTANRSSRWQMANGKYDTIIRLTCNTTGGSVMEGRIAEAFDDEEGRPNDEPRRG